MPGENTDNASTSGAGNNTSANDDVRSEGIGSRTQSCASVASSQASRASRLPDYDFGDDDRPGKYAAGKKKDKKSDKGTNNKAKNAKDVKKDSKVAKNVTKSKTTEKKTVKPTKKAKQLKSKQTKNAEKKKENKMVKTGKDNKANKGKKTGKINEAFQSELQSAVKAQAAGESPDEDEMTDIALALESEASLSRQSSISRSRSPVKTKKLKKKQPNKRKPPRGRGKSKDAKKKKKGRSQSKESIDGESGDFSDFSSTNNVITDDGRVAKSKKTKKTQQKPKKDKTKKNKKGPVVITVNDDDEDEFPKEKKRHFLGCIPLPSKREPMLYNCCFCCSLGAGSLLTGIIYVLYSIGYMVVRAGEMKQRNVVGIWTGRNLLPDVWRLLLIFGMITSACCLLASLLLIVASCLWGYKEHYERMRKCILIWVSCTLGAVLNNVGEAVYVVTMPNIIIDDWVHSSDDINKIKENIPTWVAMAAPHALLFVYLFIVLVSYLRLLKYLDVPKIGRSTTPATVPAESGNTGNATSSAVAAKTPKKKPRTKSLSAATSEPNLQNISEIESQPRPSKRNLEPEKELPSRSAKKEIKLQRHQTFNDRIYENTSFLKNNEEAGPSAPLSRVASELSLGLPDGGKKESFKDVLNDITNDPSIFENMSKPKPLERIPVRSARPKTKPAQEAIYVNQSSFEATQTLPPDLRNEEKKPPYSQVSKPLKRASSFSDARTPVYDDPTPEIDLDELLQKSLKKEKNDSVTSSKDTGFNSETISRTISNSGSQADINEMERLADKLRKEQEALDKSGNCDPAVAENLTQMAINALRLSERILQDVKATEQNKRMPVQESEESPSRGGEPIKQNLKLAESFFDELARDPNAMTENPIEEMFRMYGKDLCSQNPEMVDRYLMSYKALQDGKPRPHPIRPGFDMQETVVKEEQPWRSIMNPSEAVPAASPFQNMQMQQMRGPQNPMDPLLSSMSQQSMNGPLPYPTEDPRRTQSAFGPIHAQSPVMSQPFHALSHAVTGPPPPNAFYPIEYPMQNSASYNPEPPGFASPQSSMVPYKPPQYDPRNMGQAKWGPNRYPQKPMHPDNMYYDEECPYSCCYTMYDDYGSIYGDYGGYPPSYMGSDQVYGDSRMYNGSNWYPMGDPAYSLDPYYNPYEYWDEPAPPYTERSTGSSSRPRTSSRPTASSRGYTSKAGSSSKGYDSRAGSTSRATSSKGGSTSRTGYSSRGYDSKAGSSSRGYSARSHSLPNLLDDSLYSESQSSYFGSRRSRSSQRLAKWGIENDDDRDTLGRPQSRGSKSTLKRANTFNAKIPDDSTEEAFIKGYTAALREAFITLSSNNDDAVFARKASTIKNQEDLLEKLISKASSRSRTESSDKNFFDKGEKVPRTFSSELRHGDARTTSHDTRNSSRISLKPSQTSRNTSRNPSRGSGNIGNAPRNISRASGSTSRALDMDEILSSRLTRKISKPDFRPPSRPGQILIDDPYDDYRSTSSVPPSKDELDDFGFSRKSSRESGLRNVRSGNSRASEQSEDILSTFELMSTTGGRPSTRSRASNHRNPSRGSSREFAAPPSSVLSSEMTYPYSENEGGNFYNTLNLDGRSSEMAYPDKHIHKDGGSARSRTLSRGSVPSNAPRSRSASAQGRMSKQEKPVMWFMGEDNRDPIYSSDYGDVRTRDSFASGGKQQLHRSSSFSYSDAKPEPEQQRLESFGSSKRKVTFGSSPNIKEVDRRTSWN